MKKLVGKLRQKMRKLMFLRQIHETYLRNTRRNYNKERERVRALPTMIVERRMIVNLMTNWQRSQWAKAKYPKDPDELRRFATMKRRSK